MQKRRERCRNRRLGERRGNHHRQQRNGRRNSTIICLLRFCEGRVEAALFSDRSSDFHQLNGLAATWQRLGIDAQLSRLSCAGERLRSPGFAALRRGVVVALHDELVHNGFRPCLRKDRTIKPWDSNT